MVSYNLDDTESLTLKINQKAHDLFKEKKGKAGLGVTRVFKKTTGKGTTKNVFVKDLDVCDAAQVEGLIELDLGAERHQGNKDTTQIWTISQDRSWTTLNISRELFSSFMQMHNIFAPFWKHMFTFGRKSEENEFEFPHLARRRKTFEHVVSNEYAYILRRVELNGRDMTEDDNPWSIRQTAVYHKLTMPNSNKITEPDLGQVKSTFLLVAPSKTAELQVSHCLDSSTGEDGHALSPWNVHRILVADSLRGWMDYMGYLERKLKNQSDQIVLASVGDDRVNLSPLTDFVINFEDRQELKIIEDQILDLQVILPGILDTIEGLSKEFSDFRDVAFSSLDDELDELCAVVDEFGEYKREVQMMIKRSKILNDKAISTARLMSDLLSYEEAVSLKRLSIETQLESKSMCHLAEKSTKDAAAVKILTVITLIYLPFTIVANFFSTEFVQNTNNHLTVLTNVWLLAAIAIPLTLLTIGLWWAWVHFTKVQPTFNPDLPGTVILQRQHSFRSIVSLKKRQKSGDLESGLVRSIATPTPIGGSPTSTWSSQAPTMKSG